MLRELSRLSVGDAGAAGRLVRYRYLYQSILSINCPSIYTPEHANKIEKSSESSVDLRTATVERQIIFDSSKGLY